MSYLKEELYQLVRNDSRFFDFIQEHAIDGLSYQNNAQEWKNPKLCLTLGYKNQETLQKNNDGSHLQDLNSFKKIDINSDTDLSLLHTQQFAHKNGTTISMLCKTLAVKNEKGEVISILKGFTKINTPNQPTLKDKKIEEQVEKLQKQEDFIEKINSAASIGYWDFNLIKQQIHWSSMTKVIHEVPKDYEPQLETAIDFFKEGESRNKITATIEIAISKGQAFDLELQLKTAKNNSRWVRSIGQSVIKDGKCIRIYGTFQDITLAKENHIALLQEKEKLQSVIHATNSGTWEWNIQTGETHHSELWAKIIGYRLDELHPITTEKWEKLVHPDDIQLSKSRMDDCFEKKTEYYNCEYRLKHRDGSWVWVLDKGKIISWTDDGSPLMMFGTHTDISEQKMIIQRNIMFIEQTPNAIAMFDIEMNYLAASEKWKKEYKLIDREIIGKSHYEIFPEISDEWKEIHQKCLAGTSFKNDEDKFIKKDGELQWLEWEVKPWYNDKGVVAGLIMYTADITARKKTEEQLRISEEAFRGNFENAAIGMALLNEKGQWLKVNQNFCNLLGYSDKELMKLTLQDITHPDDLEADLKLLNELIIGERKFYHLEKKYICKDGSIINIILAASLVRDANNKPLYFISQIIDITQQKKADLNLAEALSKIQGILDASTHVSIIETDINGTITTFNKGAENLLGYSKSEILNKKTPIIIHIKDEIEKRKLEISNEPSDSIHDFSVFTYEANKGNFDTREWTYIKKNGTQFPVQLTVTSIKTNGEITGYLGIAVDISSLKEAEKEIQSLLHVTKDQNERLKNFTHIVSHNLRSHSGNMAMMLDLLIYENPEFAKNEFIELLGVASNNLKETIQHLNEVVLINTSIKDNLVNLNLNNYFESALTNINILAINANVTIVNQINPDIMIQGVPAYLDSILLNFLTNGIKYKSEERDSYIKMHCTEEDQYIILHIEDNGIGIDLKKNRNKLFGMYKTFHNNTDARGIGLFITKNQIEAIGGKIEVNSELNKGTTFKIYFKNEKN
ncbi:PAS domain S-box protein [Flavobacterium degerlachei]|jgi:PAS domain S-box-containing protein|uniref:histidine kinase n=1 Tax=Flavobacterium degerlachei TaxID=229203 RepID=A0A1H2SSN0_9FLAO|nr:PAS domain S-box protein [Flavobacterium degerlachei]SDW34600.1 PAS domain S-box-containing protein [Flavobacterium degerlachei]